jgi:hypothetical protein
VVVASWHALKATSCWCMASLLLLLLLLPRLPLEWRRLLQLWS